MPCRTWSARFPTAIVLAVAAFALSACASARPAPEFDDPPPHWGDRYWGSPDRVPSPAPVPMPVADSAPRANAKASAILTRESTWIREREWTGEAPRRTERFPVPSRWRLLWWSGEGSPETPLIIEAFRAEGDELVARVSQDGPSEETSSLQLPEPGTYYLDIQGTGAWYVAIEVPAP